MNTPAEMLPDAWADTAGKIADELVDAYAELRAAQGRVDHLKQTLLDISSEYSNGMDDPWWQGGTIRGKRVAWYAAMRLVEGGDNPKWEKHLMRVSTKSKNKEQGNDERTDNP